MSLVSSMGIAQQALAVNQAAISVIANNIANVDNENYSKLRVNMAEAINYTKLTGSAVAEVNTLSGVQISEIKRYANEYLESYYRTENSSYSYLEEYSSIASNVEDLMNELNDTGLTDALSNFYDAAAALADSPTDITLRQNYASCAENVCSVFNNIHKSLNGLKESLVGDYNLVNSVDSSEIGTQAGEVNNLLEQLAEVNINIIKTNSTDTSSSSLLDKRDAILEKLSSYIPINTKLNDNGTMDVSLGNYDLVSGTVVKGYLNVETGTANQPAVINIVDKNKTVIYADVNEKINSGSMGAILSICGDSSSTSFTITNVIEEVNTLAKSFAEELNRIQTEVIGGTTPMCLTNDYSQLAVSTTPLFLNNNSIPPGITDIDAGNISVNSEILNNLYLIAAARVTDPSDTTATGNNQNIMLVSDSRNETYSGLENQSFEGYLATVVSSIGTDVSSIDSSLETQNVVLKQVESRLQSETGVSLDQELGDLIKYQQAYGAAARVFSVCSSLLGDLIHLGE